MIQRACCSKWSRHCCEASDIHQQVPATSGPFHGNFIGIPSGPTLRPWASLENSGEASSKGARSAARWLWEQQQDDGGWHSSTYGLLKSGQALTPFILHTLLQARSQFKPPERRVQQAIQFIQQHTNNDGVLGVADPDLLEYPN